MLGWFLASLGFAFYANNFGSSDATYSSIGIGAVIILLTWMHVRGLFILIGGEINAEIALTVAVRGCCTHNRICPPRCARELRPPGGVST